MWQGRFWGSRRGVRPSNISTNADIILFLVISFITLAILVETEDVFNGYIVLAVLSGLFLAIIPVYSLTLKGTSLRLAVKSWRKALKKGTYPVGSDPAQREKLLQYAIVLGVWPSFVHHYGKVRGI